METLNGYKCKRRFVYLQKSHNFFFFNYSVQFAFLICLYPRRVITYSHYYYELKLFDCSACACSFELCTSTVPRMVDMFNSRTLSYIIYLVTLTCTYFVISDGIIVLYVSPLFYYSYAYIVACEKKNSG